jgi:hypothetical protein
MTPAEFTDYWGYTPLAAFVIITKDDERNALIDLLGTGCIFTGMTLMMQMTSDLVKHYRHLDTSDGYRKCIDLQAIQIGAVIACRGLKVPKELKEELKKVNTERYDENNKATA